MVKDNMAEQLREIAENAVARFRDKIGIELGYDRASVEWIDGYIERARVDLEKEAYDGLATALGAHLGECFIASYGGEWDYFEDLNQWGVRFGEKSGVFPFSKVYKQLENGAEDSVSSLFTALPVILKQKSD